MSSPAAPRPRAVVVGAGPGGLMAAEVLATAGVSVTVYERMPSIARKFLLAGRGGLNLTHTEALEQFLDRYGSARPFLRGAIEAFGPDALRSWCVGLGQDPFVGSSGRVFPAGFRSTALLRAWQARLDTLGVQIRTGHSWRGWVPAPADGRTDAGAGALDRPAPLLVESDGEVQTVVADVVVLSLGGASWPKIGSDGAWVPTLRDAGVEVAPLGPANSGFVVDWSEVFAERFAGEPLKNVALSVPGRTPPGETVRGEVMIVEDGIEGGGVYALGRELRAVMESNAGVVLQVDLRPDLSEEQIRERIERRRTKDSVTKVLQRAVGLAPVAVGLLREATANHLPTDAAGLASLVKALPLQLVASQPLERAISTAGGIRLDEIDASYMLRRRPGVFVAGEMLDWEAPTGGYLLQATFSTAVAAAHGALDFLAARDGAGITAPGDDPDRSVGP